MATTLIATTTFKQMCELSRCLTNGVERDGNHRTDVVYMAPHSWGGRTWKTADAVHRVADIDDDVWLGFAEEGSSYFKWESASSGAVIDVTRNIDGSWKLHFVGTERLKERNGRESAYLFEFAMAVGDPKSITVENAEDGLVFQFEQWVESTRARDDQHRPSDDVIDHVEKVGAFIAQYEIDAHLEEDEQLEREYGDSWR